MFKQEAFSLVFKAAQGGEVEYFSPMPPKEEVFDTLWNHLIQVTTSPSGSDVYHKLRNREKRPEMVVIGGYVRTIQNDIFFRKIERELGIRVVK